MKQINNQKLRVVTRCDLPIQIQATQACHAAIDFQHQYGEISRDWQTNSNYLVLLSTVDESALDKLIYKAHSLGIKHTVFREPDINNEITAVAFEPSNEAKKMTSSIPLMGKNLNNIN